MTQPAKEFGVSVKTSRPASQTIRPGIPDNCPSCGKDLAKTARNGLKWATCWPGGGGCGWQAPGR